MKLKEKLFKFTTQDGKKAVLSKKEKIIIIINDREWKIEAVLKKHSIEDGEFYAYSLLQYFIPKEGCLTREGIKIKFLNEKREPLNITDIKIPYLYDEPVNISVEYIKNFCNAMGIKNYEIFSDLSEQEKEELKKIFTTDEKKDEKKKEDERLADEKKKEDEQLADEKKKEDELKESIGADFVQEWNDYIHRKKEFEREGAKEYVKDKYHIFYSNDTDPLILFQAGEKWFEETGIEVDSENPKTAVLFSFSVIDGRKKITINLETAELIIEDAPEEEPEKVATQEEVGKENSETSETSKTAETAITPEIPKSPETPEIPKEK